MVVILSDLVVVRVPKHVKEKMKKLNINWSEYLRKKIEEKLEKERLKILWEEIEEIKKKIPPSPTKNFSVESIREDRER